MLSKREGTYTESKKNNKTNLTNITTKKILLKKLKILLTLIKFNGIISPFSCESTVFLSSSAVEQPAVNR